VNQSYLYGAEHVKSSARTQTKTREVLEESKLNNRHPIRIREQIVGFLIEAKEK
jgi:hypothetical protein